MLKPSKNFFDWGAAAPRAFLHTPMQLMQLVGVSANVICSRDRGLTVNMYTNNFEVFSILKYVGPGFFAPLIGNRCDHD